VKRFQLSILHLHYEEIRLHLRIEDHLFGMQDFFSANND